MNVSVKDVLKMLQQNEFAGEVVALEAGQSAGTHMSISGSLSETVKIGNRSKEETWDEWGTQYENALREYIRQHHDENLIIRKEKWMKHPTVIRETPTGREQFSQVDGKAVWVKVRR